MKRASILVSLAILLSLTACPRPAGILGTWSVMELDIPGSLQIWTFFRDGTVNIDTLLYPTRIEAEYVVEGQEIRIGGLAESPAAPTMAVRGEILLSDDESNFSGFLRLSTLLIPSTIVETDVQGSREDP